MEKQHALAKPLILSGIITMSLLAIPMIAMQFTEEVNWEIHDFILMGILVFISGFSILALSRSSGKLSFKIGITLAFGTTFLMFWANLAVGLIGSGDHVGNLLYVGVIGVFILSLFLSQFESKKLENAMYANVLALLVHAIVVLFLGVQHYEGTSVIEILGVNGFFIFLYLMAALCFRKSGLL